VREGIKGSSKQVALNEPDEVVIIGKPTSALLAEVTNEAKSEEKRIAELLSKFHFDPKTVRSFDNDPWGRAVRDEYSQTPLSTDGAVRRGGRFNFKPRSEVLAARVLYVGDSEKTALTECTHGLRPIHSFKYFPVIVDLQRVWDLRTAEACETNGIQRDILLSVEHESWEYFQDVLMIPAYSQKIGAFAFDHSEIEAIAYPSARINNGGCLAIFLDKLLFGSTVVVVNPVQGTAVIRFDGIKPLSISTD